MTMQLLYRKKVKYLSFDFSTMPDFWRRVRWSIPSGISKYEIVTSRGWMTIYSWEWKLSTSTYMIAVRLHTTLSYFDYTVRLSSNYKFFVSLFHVLDTQSSLYMNVITFTSSLTFTRGIKAYYTCIAFSNPCWKNLPHT